MDRNSKEVRELAHEMFNTLQKEDKVWCCGGPDTDQGHAPDCQYEDRWSDCLDYALEELNPPPMCLGCGGNEEPVDDNGFCEECAAEIEVDPLGKINDRLSECMVNMGLE